MSIHGFCEQIDSTKLLLLTCATHSVLICYPVTEENIWNTPASVPNIFLVYHLPLLACYCGGCVEWDVQTFVAENSSRYGFMYNETLS